MNNPYSWNSVNPDLCYGRDSLLADLLSGLPGSPRYSFGISGGRRMGKTTILRRVEKDLRSGIDQWKSGGLHVIPIYIDGLVLPRPLSPTYIWGYIIGELNIYFKEPITFDLYSLDFISFKRLIQPVLSNMVERPRIIILFDEIEPIIVNDWAAGFLGQWRALLSNTPDLSEYFTAVFAGAREMEALQIDLGSPLKDIVEWKNLRRLEYDDACRLMQEPISHKWPLPFLQKAYNETGGHPMLLQYIMQQVCMHNFEDAGNSLDQAVLKFPRERSWQFNEWWQRYCTPLAQRVYSSMSDDGTTRSLREITREFGSNDANDALEILQHVGLIACEDDGFSFRYSGEMFRNWYRVYGALSEVPQHDPELYSRLRRIGPEVADKYLSAWKIYQGNIPNYSGVLVELRGVLEFIVDKYAPVEIVKDEPNFKLETGHQIPTLRQRLRFLGKQLYNNERAKELVSDYNLLEIAFEQLADRLAQTATIAHRSASAMAHETATRDMAYRGLKQWDAILAQLLPENGLR